MEMVLLQSFDMKPQVGYKIKIPHKKEALPNCICKHGRLEVRANGKEGLYAMPFEFIIVII